MKRNTSGLAHSQPAIQAPTDFFADAHSLEEHGLAETALWVHARIVGAPHSEYALEARLAAASLASRDRRRATPRTIQRRVAKLVDMGFLALIAKDNGKSQVLTLGAKYSRCRGVAYKNSSQNTDTHLPVSASADHLSLSPHRDTVSPSTEPDDGSTLISEENVRLANDVLAPSVSRVGPCRDAGDAPEPDQKATSVKRTPLGGPSVDDDEALGLLDAYVGHCQGVGVQHPRDTWPRIHHLLRAFHPSDILDAWESDRIRCMPSHMWDRGVNLEPKNIKATLDRYLAM